MRYITHMQNISVKLPFDYTQDQTREAYRKLVREVCRAYLGRSPTEEDETQFRQIANPGNSSANDLYFQGQKIGCLSTTYILDSPRSIKLEFTTNQ
jgi:hypothetical protein